MSSAPVLRRLAGFLAALLGLACLAACVRLPDSGPVRGAPDDESQVVPQGIPYEPPGPTEGQVPGAVVTGFLDAMMASPIQLSTARDYLTRKAAADWEPQQRLIVHGGTSPVSTPAPGDAQLPDDAPPRDGVRGLVVVHLADARWLDSRGRWRGALPPEESTLRVPVTVEGGEWRIAAAPDAVVVHETWFEQHYGQFSLHFFDPSSRTLVPEPVHVPTGDQLATALVRGLVAGPPDPDPAGLVSLLQGAELVGGTVTVSRGVATIALSRGIDVRDPQRRELLAAQLAWTLRQVPSITALRVTVGGAPLALEGGLTQFPVGVGVRYDPAIASASDALYGIVDGQPVELREERPVPTPGPLAAAYRVRDVSVDLAGTMLAAVSEDGRDLLLAPLRDGQDAVVTTPVRGATDLAHPAWDGAGRTWVLDRRRDGAAISVLAGGARQVVTVPGVSGENAVDLLVSRDGTRLVTALRRPSGDVVVTSRVDWTTGSPQVGPARVIHASRGRTPVRDLAWWSPTEVLVLSAVAAGLSEVDAVSVDDSPHEFRGGLAPDLIRARVTRLVASPADSAAAWAITADGSAIEIGRPTSQQAPRGATALTYVG